jgi:hypothetical protein
MQLDEPFPLEAVPSRVRHAFLREFKGRCPSLREVDEITDKDWLATPGIGSTSLETIRSITNARRQQAATHTDGPMLSDAELLRRLDRLQEDLRCLEAHLRRQTPTGRRRRPHPHRDTWTARGETDHLGLRAGEAEAPHP